MVVRPEAMSRISNVVLRDILHAFDATNTSVATIIPLIVTL
jgi:hypothetical protein